MKCPFRLVTENLKYEKVFGEMRWVPCLEKEAHKITTGLADCYEDECLAYRILAVTYNGPNVIECLKLKIQEQEKKQ